MPRARSLAPRIGGETSDAAWRARLEELELHELDFASLAAKKKSRAQ